MQYKLLWIASWYPNSESPTNGDFIQRMGWALDTPIVLIHATQGLRCDFELTDIQKRNIREIICYFPRTDRWKYAKLFRMWRSIKAYQKAFRYVRSLDIDFNIIHLHVAWPAGLIILIHSRYFNMPLIITEHWSGLRRRAQGYLTLIQRVVIRKLWKKAKVILPVAEALKEDMVHFLPSIAPYTEVMPNVIDTDLFKANNGTYLPNKRFLFVGTLDDTVKNISGIIKAFAGYHFNDPESELICIGEGPDKTNLIELTRKLKLEKCIRFTGQVMHLEVSQWMKKSTALISFSYYENLPCVILEALSSGLPVITNETGDMHLWIDNNNGILLQNLDIKLLEDALRMISKMSFNRESIRKTILQKCSIEVIKGKLNIIYYKALSDHKRR